jgi:hypothetical protein
MLCNRRIGRGLERIALAYCRANNFGFQLYGMGCGGRVQGRGTVGRGGIQENASVLLQSSP